MAAPAAPKEQLRLFAKIGGSAGDEARGKSAPGPGAAGPPPTTAGSWGLHALATTRHDFPATSLLLGVLAGPSAAAPLRPFDRSSGGDGNRGDQEGALAAALARQLLPGGWALLSLRLARWQARLAVESPCGGVPGLSRFFAGRAAWLRTQLRQAVEQEQCRWAFLPCAPDREGGEGRGPTVGWRVGEGRLADGINQAEGFIRCATPLPTSCVLRSPGAACPLLSPASSAMQAGGAAARRLQRLLARAGDTRRQGGPAEQGTYEARGRGRGPATTAPPCPAAARVMS